jgi:hypothetical protein
MLIVAQEIVPPGAAAAFPWDTVINIIFFALGTGLGLFQVWQSNNHRALDQKSKFESIDRNIGDIQTKLAIIEGVTSRLVDMDKTIATLGTTSTLFQDRMFGIVERQIKPAQQIISATTEASQQAKDEINNLITQGLSQSGAITEEKIGILEEKIEHIFSDLDSKINLIQKLALSESRKSQPLLWDNPNSVNNRRLIYFDYQGKKLICENESLQLRDIDVEIISYLISKSNFLPTSILFDPDSLHKEVDIKSEGEALEVSKK